MVFLLYSDWRTDKSCSDPTIASGLEVSPNGVINPANYDDGRKLNVRIVPVEYYRDPIGIPCNYARAHRNCITPYSRLDPVETSVGCAVMGNA